MSVKENLIKCVAGLRRTLFFENGQWNMDKELGADQLAELVELVGELELLPLVTDDEHYLMEPLECLKAGAHEIEHDEEECCIVCGAPWWYSLRNGKVWNQKAGKFVPVKKKRVIKWDDLEDWEHLLVPNTHVKWKGANGVVYDTTLLHIFNGNARLRFADGHECEPCYIERFVGIETEDESIKLVR